MQCIFQHIASIVPASVGSALIRWTVLRSGLPADVTDEQKLAEALEVCVLLGRSGSPADQAVLRKIPGCFL